MHNFRRISRRWCGYVFGIRLTCFIPFATHTQNIHTWMCLCIILPMHECLFWRGKLLWTIDNLLSFHFPSFPPLCKFTSNLLDFMAILCMYWAQKCANDDYDYDFLLFFIHQEYLSGAFIFDCNTSAIAYYPFKCELFTCSNVMYYLLAI